MFFYKRQRWEGKWYLSEGIVCCEGLEWQLRGWIGKIEIYLEKGLTIRGRWGIMTFVNEKDREHTLGYRSTVGQLILDQSIEVRILVPQP
jgi:hypothetical protein